MFNQLHWPTLDMIYKIFNRTPSFNQYWKFIPTQQPLHEQPLHDQPISTTLHHLIFLTLISIVPFQQPYEIEIAYVCVV